MSAKITFSKTTEDLVWSIFSWLYYHNSTQLRIGSVTRHNGAHECFLENDACGTMYNFDLKNKIDLLAVNALMCFWANTSLSNRTVELGNGKTIDISNLDLTNKKDIKKLAL